MSDTPSLQLRNVSMTYRARGRAVEALRDVTFSMGRHEFVSIIGPSGCGKSTILRLVADILRPTAGEILINGAPPSEARKARAFGFVFQDPVMVPWRTVLQNVQLPLEIMGADKGTLDAKPRSRLELVGLKGFEHVVPTQLSGGMKQRAAIARALTLDPPLLLMDEPFGALDEITRDRMNLELLRVWKETTASVLFVTHSIEEAVFLSDRVIVMSARPGCITTIVDTALPRPRTTQLKRSQECFLCTQTVREALYAGI